MGIDFVFDQLTVLTPEFTRKFQGKGACFDGGVQRHSFRDGGEQRQCLWVVVGVDRVGDKASSFVQVGSVGVVDTFGSWN